MNPFPPSLSLYSIYIYGKEEEKKHFHQAIVQKSQQKIKGFLKKKKKIISLRDNIGEDKEFLSRNEYAFCEPDYRYKNIEK